MNDILRYIGIFSPTFVVGLLTAGIGVIVFISGSARRRDAVRNIVFPIIMLICGAFLCIGFLPHDIVSGFVEFRKPLRIAATLICNPICTAFGVVMMLYAAINICIKARPTVYGDLALRTVSIVWGTITELFAAGVIYYSIQGFLNYMNI